MLRIQAELVECFGLLAELGTAVSVFGSARTPAASPEYERAEQIGLGLAQAGYAAPITSKGVTLSDGEGQEERAPTRRYL